MILLRFPPTLQYRDLAMRAVGSACKLVGAGGRGDHFDEQVISAFSEAFNNLALHGYRDRPMSDVQIEIDVAAEELTIRMIDEGTSFDFKDVPDPDLESLPEGGFGVYIMKSFMDQVDYRTGIPNVLTMSKRRAR